MTSLLQSFSSRSRRGAADRPLAFLSLIALFLYAFQTGRMERAATAQGQTPTATLVPTRSLQFTGEVDSNSPAMWEMVDGRPLLHVITSFAGQPSLSSGSRLTRLDSPRAVQFVSHPGFGVWMEAVVADEGGVWYGYYHNEVPAFVCDRLDRMLPRIGAARSTDRGRTWEDLGIILEAPPGAEACNTPNRYFVGGVGDLSVMLDEGSTNLYLFFSQYSRPRSAQGIGVARVLWSDRDEPVGRVDVWVDGIWLPPDAVLEETKEEAEGETVLTWRYPAGTPLVQPTHPWHDGHALNDAFWGPSVHWNTSLRQYVMLLNRAKDEQFSSEGVYVSFASALDDPRLWSPPVRILRGGTWYPQVVGLEPGNGTDKRAGALARFFMGGSSSYFIEFAYK